GRDESRPEAEPREIFVHALEPLRIDVEREQIELRELGEMGGLAAGCGAGIEHAHALARVEQRRRELGTRVLNRKPALRVAWKLGHRAWFLDDHSGDADRCSGDPAT